MIETMTLAKKVSLLVARARWLARVVFFIKCGLATLALVSLALINAVYSNYLYWFVFGILSLIGIFHTTSRHLLPNFCFEATSIGGTFLVLYTCAHPPHRTSLDTLSHWTLVTIGVLGTLCSITRVANRRYMPHYKIRLMKWSTASGSSSSALSRER
uniref:ORF51 n=1 Tax=Latid herpesvirus 1 TaxID=3096545 RepID=A0AB33V6Y8_9VIRU